ncbi:MAG TPA: DUF2314 domain-containing protein [Solimonas sp.]|nr:DUF2314 domain-containing protein [Solimonas sp.]
MKLATLFDEGWTLDDGEARHNDAPDAFEIPNREERENLKPGQLVKLMFRIALEGEDGKTAEEVERMWVLVSGRVGQTYRGVLDNDPRCTKGIRAGLEVVFEPRHVIQIESED